MKLSTARDKFLDSKRMDRKAAWTIAGYKSDLNMLVAMATVESADSVLAFTPDLVRAFFLKISSKGQKMATLQRRRATLNEFARWGLRERYWAESPMTAAPMIKRPKRVPRPYQPEEFARIMALELGLEDRAIRATLYYTGLRVTPVATLRLGDLSFSPTTFGDGLVVPGTIRAISKGDKESVKPMHPELWGILQDYYLRRMGQVDAKHFHKAPLFEQPRAARSGALPGRPFNRKIIERRCRHWGRAAAVPSCLPHRFRHTFATNLLESGADIRLIQHLLDHEDIGTTALYLKVADASAAKAVLGLRSFAQPPRVTGTGSGHHGQDASGTLPNSPPGKESARDGR